jgi:hypothetical protein
MTYPHFVRGTLKIKYTCCEFQQISVDQYINILYNRVEFWIQLIWLRSINIYPGLIYLFKTYLKNCWIIDHLLLRKEKHIYNLAIGIVNWSGWGFYGTWLEKRRRLVMGIYKVIKERLYIMFKLRMTRWNEEGWCHLFTS